ncbi:MAG: hypothetical protein IT561_12435 [Alphaproteobacteria bacterium]|nr:hypothetical protein [Alphaproteobacteria bacterium]
MDSGGPATNTFIQRLIGAAACDVAVYEDVEADRGATLQACAVVVLSSLAGGLGLGGLTGGPFNIAFFSMVALLAWASWALLTYVIGVHLLPEPQTRADVGELMRTIGFASTPGLLRVLGIMEPVAAPVLVVTAVWMLVAMVVAVRQALDYRSTARAIVVCVTGWVLAIAFAIALGLIFAPTVS